VHAALVIIAVPGGVAAMALAFVGIIGLVGRPVAAERVRER
jgi:hypothetical protein